MRAVEVATNMKKTWVKIVILSMMLVFALALTACELQDPSTSVLYFINDNAANQFNKDRNTKDNAIDKVTDSITNLRSYLDNEAIATTGYYMGVEFNIDTQDPITLEGGNFRLKVQAHLYTYRYLQQDDKGNVLKDEFGNEIHIFKYYDKKDGKYYDTNNQEGTRVLTDAEDIHNEVIKKSNILIEWYNGTTNQMLIGMYFDGINNNADDPGNVLYLNIQNSKRSFPEFGDTVLYQQLIRLLMSLSVESLLTAGNIQGDAGVSTLRALFGVAVNDNYKVVLNSPITSVLFYSIAADAIASNLTGFIQGLFSPFEDKIDPLTLKYLGFDFSVVGSAVINSVNSDMQFFTEPDPNNVKEIMTGAYLTFAGASLSRGSIYNYVSDVTFEYGPYPPEEMALDRLYYTEYDYGNYEFVGNLYVPMLNANFDALIRTDIQQYDNSINNVFMEFSDISNGELMIGAYYKNERTYIDISGLEYLYGWIDLNQLGFPKVYDESINLAEQLGKMFKFLNNSIVSIVDAILSPDKNDKENKLLEYIMEKTVSTKKTPDDIFSKNTVTLTVDMYLIKHALEETGQGTYTTRQIINILDSLMPYTMDQIAIMLGVSSAEVMLDNTYFTFTLNVDTNEITVKMFTNVGIKPGEPSTLIFQLDVIPTVVGEYVEIAEVKFDNFKPLEQIYTYSATMNGNFVFSTAETVDMSRLLSATIGENSGKNTPYILPQKAGVTFRLIYDQFVTDQIVDGVLKKAGRSAFELTVWLTGSDETQIIIRLASDDVAFNNEVYQNQPERAAELGYVWVSIECVKLGDGVSQKIPKVKIREDVFMTSMQAYMNGTSISDDASELEGTDVNLSITSILFALVEDSYVVAQPKQLEITTSNETVQSIFRVKGLIGNIRVNAGFTYRVKGLENVKYSYGMYKVGQFENLEGNSPYDTELHDDIPVYFYEDYHYDYDDLEYDLRVDRQTGVIQVYEKGGKKLINREPINYASDSFFNNEGPNNQDISLIRFNYNNISALVLREEDIYYYLTYAGERVDIEEQYVRLESGQVYIYYLGIMDRVHHEGGSEFYYYERDMALTDSDGYYIYYYPQTTLGFMFNYDLPSIEITEAAKTQYAPRIDGSFMGTLRHYVLVMTSVLAVERGKLFELESKEYYSLEDENNIIEEFDEDGVKIKETLSPIVLYVFEPFLPVPKSTAVNIKVGKNTEIYTLVADFQIDKEQLYIKGHMEVTEVIIAKGMMGEATYPVRIIVTNREILTAEYVNIYTTNNDQVTNYVPVVDNIEIDPYDYMIAKYEFFSNIDNFNPDQYSLDSNSADYYLTQYELKEKQFANEYFSQYIFSINFNYLESVLYAEEVKPEYIATTYTNLNNNVLEKYNWNFDVFKAGNNREQNITAAEGNIINLHTYFQGQLIALRVNVGKRIFSHLKFYENDDFNPTEANAGIENNNQYIYGHYVANYFDEGSYKVPTTPVFVFNNGSGREYEKVFDLRYISGLNQDGNYIFSNMYEIMWADPKITNIGSLGSYYLLEGELVNRPFYVSHVVKDENGVIISEGTPTPGESGNDSAIDTSSLNMFWLLKIFKPIRNAIGGYEGQYKEISMVSGTSTDSGFPTIVLRITVECPKLNVAPARTESGAIIKEADELDTTGAGGSPVVFNPSAIKIGNNSVGYYLIDPLNASTNIIPRDITLYFVDPNDESGRLSSHKFKNVEWYSYIPTTTVDGNITFQAGSYTNASGYEIIKEENGVYTFNQPTDKPIVTRIMAKIGSDLSGYQLIVLCIKVLSKDPQNVEFYFGTKGETTKYISGIEKVNLSVNDDKGTKAEEYAIYTYYVNTFANFNMPTWIKAYFGVASERSELYDVTWQQVSNSSLPVYQPNSVVNLMAIIGSGDVKIRIYLVVVVANYSISNIELVSDYNSLLVKVGSHNNYVQVSDLLQKDFVNNKMGLYQVDGYLNNYLLLSTGSEQDGLVEIGKLGCYRFIEGVYVLQAQMYPYEFLNSIYSRMNIFFNNSQLVDYANVSNYYTRVYSSESNQTLSVKLNDAIEFSYSFDAGTQQNKLNVTYRYLAGDGYYYYLNLDENDMVRVYLNSDMVEQTSISLEVHELTSLLTHERSAEDIRSFVVDTVTLQNGTIDGGGKPLSAIYTFLSGNLTYYSPQDITERMSFISITFTNGRVMTVEELNYRLLYLERNRRQNTIVTPIRNKVTSINNFSGIFSINDIVRESIDPYSFQESPNFIVSLGTGRNAYDMTLRIIFDGGLRVSVDSMASQTIDIEPYSGNGTANYGNNGYSLAVNVSAEIKVVKQDNTGSIIRYYYGDQYGISTQKLTSWYVSQSSYESVPVGSVITTIEQSLIYSSEGGSLTITTLTAEGFRLTRVLNFTGVPETIDHYNSTLATGLLIRNGRITVEDIYNYMPITTYFGGTAYLPKEINATLSGKSITVSNVNWEISPNWRQNVLAQLSYYGTNDLQRVIATAEILGWESYEGGKQVYHDRITITLYIVINSAEVAQLPWLTTSLRLNTLPIIEDVGGVQTKIQAVDVDAFNDMNSGAISNATFILPQNIIVQYVGGAKHTFYGVTYKFRNVDVAYIPYNIQGIDVDAMSDQLSLNVNMFETDHIDLQVSLGLMQTLIIRFRFYDKTVVNVVPDLSLTNTGIRNQINDALGTLDDELSDRIQKDMNLIRIQANIEKLIETARLIRNNVAMPLTQNILGMTSLAPIRAELVKGWIGFDIISNPQVNPPGQPLSAEQCYNYALPRLRTEAESYADSYARNILDIINTSSLALRAAAIKKQVDDYVRVAYNRSYDIIISDYIKEELSVAFVKEMQAMDSYALSYALYYKNYMEASLNIESIISGIYRIREQINCGIYDMFADANLLNTLYKNIIIAAVQNAMTVAKAKVNNEAISAIIDNIVWMRLGVNSASGSQYQPLTKDINYIVASDLYKSKVELRAIFKEMISSAMDFSIKAGDIDIISSELHELIPLMVQANVDSISGLSTSISAVRRNLISDIDIGSLINNIFERGIDWFVREIYMESQIVSAIKRVQLINTSSDGYYYIDPYYDYTILPSTFIADFAEANGGFSYYFSTVWDNDNISSNITYKGNAKNNLYGYLYSWYTYYNNHSQNPFLNTVLSDIVALVEGKTWQQIKNDNMSIANTLAIIDTLVYSFYPDTNPSNEDARKIELFIYYRAGDRLLSYGQSYLAGQSIDKTEVLKLFDSNKYDLVTSTLFNSRTGESQVINLVVIVNNRTLDSGDLVVIDKDGTEQNKVIISDPFLSNIDSIPSYIDVNGEIMKIIWDGVTVDVKGNLDKASQRIYGYIKDSRIGQRVSIELYVNKWSYNGIYYNVLQGNEEVRVLLNPIDFYFNNYIQNSAMDKYEIMFSIQEPTFDQYGDVKKDLNNKIITKTTVKYQVFYPEDSIMLENTTFDSDMQEIFVRNKYVMYWDTVAKAAVLNPDKNVTKVAAVVEIGNESIGRISVRDIKLPTSSAETVANYNFDDMSIELIKVVDVESSYELYPQMESKLLVKSGVAAVVMSVDSVYPVTGNLTLHSNNIYYDPNNLTIRFLWNKKYAEAIKELEKFIADSYPEVEAMARNEYAINILMNFASRTTTENEELFLLACKYQAKIFYSWPDNQTDLSYATKNTAGEYVSFSDRCQRNANALLMIDEKYDFTKEPARLKGGVNGNKSMTVLIRVGSSNIIYTQEVTVKVIFSDYKPIAYYSRNAYNVYTQIGFANPDSLPSELFMAVRTDYWDTAQNQNIYVTNGEGNAYDNIDNFSYMLLHYSNKDIEGYKINNEVINGINYNLRLKHITDIVYGAPVGNTVTSTSFKIDGILYYSNLIQLRVS